MNTKFQKDQRKQQEIASIPEKHQIREQRGDSDLLQKQFQTQRFTISFKWDFFFFFCIKIDASMFGRFLFSFDNCSFSPTAL